MDSRIAKVLATIDSFDKLEQFEANIERQQALTDEISAALKARSMHLGRNLIIERTGIDLSNLTPAEERIVEAVSEYVAVKKRDGKNAARTLIQLQNRGLIEAAETAVSKAKPTQGFVTFKEEDLEGLSYEQIILDHPEEFSPRARWYANRRLGHPTDGDRPPARRGVPAQLHTEDLLAWLKQRANGADGRLGHFTNADAGRAIGMDDLSTQGRAFGNIQSRLDFACYRVGLPPLGLAAQAPFADAWADDAMPWSFPIVAMQRAAQEFRWRDHDFDRLLTETATLSGRAYILWSAELRDNQARVRTWAEGLESGPRESDRPMRPAVASPRRNPDWTREELILGLDLYLRLRGTSYPDEHPEVIKLSQTLRALAELRGMSGSSTFRNANGVSMKMLNFRRVDPTYQGTGLPSGSRLEEEVWKDYADNAAGLSVATHAILEEIEAATKGAGTTEEGAGLEQQAWYWVFVCNPARWAIDRFLESSIDVDTWGVRPSDAAEFSPGQLGIVRVGVDRRNVNERDGRPALEAGIYALCEVESAAFPGTGARDSFWAAGEGRQPGWPTVSVRYLRRYSQKPLTIAELRGSKPSLSPLLLNGFQAASFPISAQDFHAVLEMLEEDVDALPEPVTPSTGSFDRLAELERRYLRASPEVKTRVSKTVERGPLGAEVKKVNGHKCQLCAVLGMNPVGFKKANGDPYVEAHHVMPVSSNQVGSLASSNIMTVCANHHRQLHYGDGVAIEITDTSFIVSINGVTVEIAKFDLYSRTTVTTDAKGAFQPSS